MNEKRGAELDSVELNPADYAPILEMFLQLRGRGSSLSGSDLQFLSKWRAASVPIELLERVLKGLDAECTSASKPFPSGLATVDRRVTKLLKESWSPRASKSKDSEGAV